MGSCIKSIWNISCLFLKKPEFKKKTDKNLEKYGFTDPLGNQFSVIPSACKKWELKSGNMRYTLENLATK